MTISGNTLRLTITLVLPVPGGPWMSEKGEREMGFTSIGCKTRAIQFDIAVSCGPFKLPLKHSSNCSPLECASLTFIFLSSTGAPNVGLIKN